MPSPTVLRDSARPDATRVAREGREADATGTDRDRDVRECILVAADRLFYVHGIHATGVDAVAAAAGVSKRTLYKHFASKERLVEAYLRRHGDRRTDPSGEPLTQLLGVFDGLERAFASGRFRGCPFVNAVGELGGDRRHPAVVAAAEFKARRCQWFAERLAALGVADPEGLALQWQILVDGAIALSAVRGGDPDVARAARQGARVLLRDAGVSAAA